MLRMATLGFLLLAAGCQTPNVRDLALDGGLYRATGYRAAWNQQRSVWIVPLRDRRGALPQYAEGRYPVSYTEDSFWSRPIVAMIEDVLRAEIQGSGIFRALAPTREAADWVIEPVVLAFHGAVEERIVGRVVRGQATLHVKVWGPRQPDGTRPLIREQQYAAPTDTAGMLMLPDPHAIAGSSLRKAVALMLLDLDHGGRAVDRAPAEAAFDPGRPVPWGGGRK